MICRRALVAVGLAAILASCGGSTASAPTTTIDPRTKAIQDGNVAACTDGSFSDNHSFSATCSSHKGVSSWLAKYGQCQDDTVIVMSEGASCARNGGFARLLAADFEPKPATGDVARCKDGTFSGNHSFRATCSSRGGVEAWLAPYGRCTDGTVITMSPSASCDSHHGFAKLLPVDYTPPTTTTPPATAGPPSIPAVVTQPPASPPMTTQVPPATAEPAVTAPPPTTPPPAAQPTPADQFANCTDMRQQYPGGVARPGAVNTGGTTTVAPTVNLDLYLANMGLDRDGDGIACER